MEKYIEKIKSPEDLKNLNLSQMEILSYEIRQFLLESISKTGGHLASNLGIVELTLALHYSFNSPKDKFVWDVGHQAYVHKILTGRKEKFDTLRMLDGLSGFPKTCESEHDCFDVGHSSTSISAALGMAMARDLKNDKNHIVSIIGDGALSGGMALEALNHLGNTKTKMIVILNDNAMSIDKNVGSISNYLNRIRTGRVYNNFKHEIASAMFSIPKIGKKVYKVAQKFKESLKHMVVSGSFFEEIGIKYYGPVDGHDLQQLCETFESLKNIDRPVIVHVITKKGKGYKKAEVAPDKYHGVGSFSLDDGLKSSSSKTYSDVFGEKICKMAKKDKRIVAVTAAMPSGTGLKMFEENFKTRFFDVGIAEGHAVTFCAGMAINGMRPFFAVYSTFFQRAFDQLIHDVAIQNLPVVFMLDRAGLVGNDGETHHGIFDLSYLNFIPNMIVMAPKDGKELEKMMDFTLKLSAPCVIRYPRGKSLDIVSKDEEIKLGKWEILNQNKNSKAVVLAIGKGVKIALEAKEELLKENIEIDVINARFLKPLDEEYLNSLKNLNIITIEDNIITSGFGQKVSSYLNEKNIARNIEIMALPEKFIEHGDCEELLKRYGISKIKLIENIKKLLERKK